MFLLLALGASACESEGPGDGAGDGGQAQAPDGEAAPPTIDAGGTSRAVDAQADGRRARVTGTGADGLNLRSGPGTGFGIVAVIPDGTEVDVVGGPDGDWWQVHHDGQIGWVHGDYLDFGSTTPPIPPPASGGLAFLLPWMKGIAFQVTQGHNRGSHTDKGAWAWDFGMPRGTPVLAAHDGTVRVSRGDSTVGGCSSSYANNANYVVVDRGDGFESLYLHLDSTSVSAGQRVLRGTVLGKSGQTGWSCGAHLHFQIQKSPSGGGTSSWYNSSVQESFHDTGAALDPPQGTRPVSANGS